MKTIIFLTLTLIISCDMKKKKLIEPKAKKLRRFYLYMAMIDLTNTIG